MANSKESEVKNYVLFVLHMNADTHINYKTLRAFPAMYSISALALNSEWILLVYSYLYRLDSVLIAYE